jgi:hypothetical protein
MSQSHKPEERVHDLVGLSGDDSGEGSDKGEEKKADVKAVRPEWNDSGEPHGDFPAAADDGGDDDGDEAKEDDTEGPATVPDGCALEEMKFEGKCTGKDEVQRILDRREREAMSKYQTAKRPQEAANAAHDLLEQQVAQVEKTEDDLDEILEILREEKKRKKGGDKKGGL